MHMLQFVLIDFINLTVSLFVIFIKIIVQGEIGIRCTFNIFSIKFCIKDLIKKFDKEIKIYLDVIVFI